MAELILKRKFKENGIKGIRVSSAGIYAEDGDKMSKNSVYALRQIGINPYAFRSRLLTEDIINSADMIICMTEGHKSALSGYKKVYTLGELTGLPDVADPFGKSKEEYVKTRREIERACDVIVEDILK